MSIGINFGSVWIYNKEFHNTAIPMATKPGVVVTYNEELPSIKSHDPLNTYSSNFHFSLQFVGLERKCLSRHQFLFIFKLDF